jgi:PD-(D/E)XK nuclease superfamily protein
MLHDAITEGVLGAAMKVHAVVGAGCLESTYDACFRYELTKGGIAFEHPTEAPVSSLPPWWRFENQELLSSAQWNPHLL